MTEELSLAKQSEKSLENYVSNGVPMGLEEYKPATEWGYLKLDQKTGKIEYTLTGEAQETWEIVILDYNFSRILFPTGMTATEPICKTIESMKNPNNLEGTKYGNCITCDYSQWVDRKPPACRQSLNFSGYISGKVAMPFTVGMRGASYKVGENLLNTLSRQVQPLFASIMNIGTSPKTRGGVDYFEFTLNESRPATDEEKALFAELHTQMVNRERKTASQEPITAEKAAEVLGGTVIDDDEPFPG